MGTAYDVSDPATSTGPVLDRLNAEWAALCASPDTAWRVRRWAASTVALGNCATLGDVADRVMSGGDDQLRALLELGASGDRLALRVVFQLFLGSAVRAGVTRVRVAMTSYDEAVQDAVVALWGAVATYPLSRRPVKIAANLKMETVGRLAARGRDRVVRDVEVPVDPSRALIFDLPGTSAATATEDVLEIVAWGVDSGVVSQRDAQLLLDVYCPEPGTSGAPANVATQRGMTQEAVRQRCSRAVRALSAAASARLISEP